MKKEILALLVVVACWGSTLQANDWKNAPISEVQKAAEQGLAEAQIVLAAMYANGEGVMQDDQQAVAWTRKAAEQGYVYAQGLLGVMYFHGRGVAQDDKQAVAWFRKAAEQGNADAQLMLGVMYDKGRGVAQDDKQSYAWFSSAAANGYSDAVKGRDIMAKRLTPAAPAEGQQLATRYFEQYRPK